MYSHGLGEVSHIGGGRDQIIIRHSTGVVEISCKDLHVRQTVFKEGRLREVQGIATLGTVRQILRSICLEDEHQRSIRGSAEGRMSGHLIRVHSMTLWMIIN